jgi:hypothetical protein
LSGKTVCRYSIKFQSRCDGILDSGLAHGLYVGTRRAGINRSAAAVRGVTLVKLRLNGRGDNHREFDDVNRTRIGNRIIRVPRLNVFGVWSASAAAGGRDDECGDEAEASPSIPVNPI